MKKDGNCITITRLVLISTLIWSGGFLIFVLIEGILRLQKGSSPWPVMMLFTILLYCICGIGVGAVFGGVLGFLRKLFKSLRQNVDLVPFVMSCCIGLLVFLFAGIFVNKQYEALFSNLSVAWISLALCFFGLFSLITFYTIFARIVDQRRLFASYCALSIALYTFMIVGLYINEHVLSGSFSAIDLRGVVVNISMAMGSISLYLIMYYLFAFISKRVGTIPRLRSLTPAMGVIFLLLLVGVALYSIMGSPSQEHVFNPSERTDDNPNIILITMDTTRADHLSCYGYHKKTTPNLDALAEESVIFTNAYATSPWTLPSHASIFTGMYPAKHGSHYDWKTMQSNWPVS